MYLYRIYGRTAVPGAAWTAVHRAAHNEVLEREALDQFAELVEQEAAARAHAAPGTRTNREYRLTKIPLEVVSEFS